MEIRHPPESEILASPIRRRLFEALAELRRRATTQELAEIVGRHPNTVRVQLRRLADAGLVESRSSTRPRGRPRAAWAVSPGADPGGEAPQAHGQLALWLARAMGGGVDLSAIEEAGREIGRELAPATIEGGAAQAMGDALTALGFKPRDRVQGSSVRYVLGNCPYRDAVLENQPVICTLHRGITSGLIEKLDSRAKLTEFVARDPYAAGCVIEVGSLSRAR